jgi:hypothetical protein
VSQSHVIYHFGKCVTISWDCDTSFGNQLLGKKFGMSSISLFHFPAPKKKKQKKKRKKIISKIFLFTFPPHTIKTFISHQSELLIIIETNKITTKVYSQLIRIQVEADGYLKE